MIVFGENEQENVGPYLLLGEIAQGGMGRVLLASREDGRLAALKTALPQLTRDEKYRSRFRKEVDASRKVALIVHAPAVLDADTDAAQQWIATEFLYGPSLEEALKSGCPLDEPSVLRLAHGLASALQEVHALGLKHLDIKPGNVMLTDRGVRLIDFGVAMTGGSGSATVTATAMAPLAYQSPEQLNEERASPKSDVFSMGTTLVTAYTGSNPFEAASPVKAMLKVLESEPDLSRLPDSLRRIVEPCLRKDPGERPTAAEVCDLIGEVPRTGPLWPREVREWTRRQREQVEGLLRRRKDTASATTAPLGQPEVKVTLKAARAGAKSSDGEPAEGSTEAAETAETVKAEVSATTTSSALKAEVPLPGPFESLLVTLKTPWGLGVVALLLFFGLIVANSVSETRSSSSDSASEPRSGTSDIRDIPVPEDDTGPDEIETPPRDPREDDEEEEEPDPFQDARVGDCLYDHGDEHSADLEEASSCDDGTFEVIRVFEGTTNKSSCNDLRLFTRSVSSSAHNRVLCLSFNHPRGETYHARAGECVYGPNDSTSPWGITPCQVGVFEVLERHRGTSDTGRCPNSGSRSYNYSKAYLEVVQCLSMIYPTDVASAPRNTCLQVTGSGSSTQVMSADCTYANAVLTERSSDYNNQAFCGYDNWYTWRSEDFPTHAFTLCWRYR